MSPATASLTTEARATVTKRAGAMLIAALAGLVVLALPSAEGLPPEGQRLAALFTAILILWITEPIPVAVTALLAVVLQPVLRIADLPAAFASFVSPVFFFVLAMYLIAQSFGSTGLGRRFALWLLARAGTDSRRVIFAFMWGTGLLSTIVSDVPCCALFMAMGLSMLQRLKLEPGRSQFAKALMMGIPIAALIGGVGTPAGSAINIIGLYFIEQYGKITIPFLHWMAIGIPMVLVMIPCAAWILTRCYPPEIASIGSVADLESERTGLGRITLREWKLLTIVGAMIVLWVASTWVRQLDTVLIALAGGCLMFLPGIDLLSWERAQRETGWDGLLLIGGVTSLGAASSESGLAKWLVDACLGGLHDGSVLWAVVVICAFTVVIHLLLPIAPVINAVLIPPITMLAIATGQSPALYGLAVAFTASCAFLLPIDAVALVTYSKGYYRMLDMLKPGALISVCWVVAMTVLLKLATLVFRW